MGLVGCGAAPSEVAVLPETANQVNFYDEGLFIKTLPEEAALESGVRGMVLPHHLTASALIHSGFSRVREGDYDLLVILGPDHHLVNRRQVTTGERSWETAFGRVAPASLPLAHPLIRVDDHRLEEEHSVGALIPFAAYYLPGTRVVSLVLSTALTMADTRELAGTLLEALEGKRFLLLASVDFSHGLPYEAARQMDEKTRRIIDLRDYQGLYDLGNESLDSPETLAVFLRIMDGIGAEGRLLETGNSFEVVGIRGEATTSYMTYLFETP